MIRKILIRYIFFLSANNLNSNYPNSKQYYQHGPANTFREAPTNIYFTHIQQPQMHQQHQRPQNLNENKYYYDPLTRQYFFTEQRPNSNFQHNNFNQSNHQQHQNHRFQNNFRPNFTQSGIFPNPNLHSFRNQQFNRNVSSQNENLNESTASESKPSVIITEVSDDDEENEFKLKAKSDKSNYVDAISLNEEEEMENESKS